MTTNGSDIRTNENPAANYMLKANNKHPKNVQSMLKAKNKEIKTSLLATFWYL